MNSHEPSGGLPPPPTRLTVTHTHIINPVVGCHYFPPGLQLPSQPSSVTALSPVPSYTACWWIKGVKHAIKIEININYRSPLVFHDFKIQIQSLWCGVDVVQSYVKSVKESKSSNVQLCLPVFLPVCPAKETEIYPQMIVRADSHSITPHGRPRPVTSYVLFLSCCNITDFVSVAAGLRIRTCYPISAPCRILRVSIGWDKIMNINELACLHLQ